MTNQMIMNLAKILQKFEPVDCEGFCKYIPIFFDSQDPNEQHEAFTLAAGLVGGINDLEVNCGNRRQIVVVEDLGYPTITRGYISVCCTRLKRFLKSNMARTPTIAGINTAQGTKTWNKLCTFQAMDPMPSLSMQEMRAYIEMFGQEILVIPPIKVNAKDNNTKWAKVEKALAQQEAPWSTMDVLTRKAQNVLLWPILVDDEWILFSTTVLDRSGNLFNICLQGTLAYTYEEDIFEQ